MRVQQLKTTLRAPEVSEGAFGAKVIENKCARANDLDMISIGSRFSTHTHVSVRDTNDLLQTVAL